MITDPHALTNPDLGPNLPFILSIASAWLMEKLKLASWFPGLTPESTASVQKLFSAVVAILTAVGVTITYDATVGTLMITGLTLSNIGQIGLLSAQNFLTQHMWYHGVIKKND
jgi:hypothetical protein